MREYLVNVTRAQSYAEPPQTSVIIEQVSYFLTHFYVADDNAAVTEKLIDLIQTYSISGKPIHDANIVATMQVNEIEKLLTNNTADFARFADMITVIPLQDNS